MTSFSLLMWSYPIFGFSAFGQNAVLSPLVLLPISRSCAKPLVQELHSSALFRLYEPVVVPAPEYGLSMSAG
ncbi:hypothetical protein [Xenorhabdus taiwanensis]|uniref:hypothetical protein n=1 Tax=Xenorhabdus taiwanensis TaxID=3085177 RepID=UPI0035A5AA76